MTHKMKAPLLRLPEPFDRWCRCGYATCIKADATCDDKSIIHDFTQKPQQDRFGQPDAL